MIGSSVSNSPGDARDATTPDGIRDLTEPRQQARGRTLDNPTGAQTAIAWVELALPTIAVNLLLLGAASAAGAAMTADVGTRTAGIGWPSVVAATSFATLSATVVWAVVAHRAPGFANLWVWLGWGVALVSVAGLLGVADVATGATLAAMHAVTTIATAHVLPRLLPRHAS